MPFRGSGQKGGPTYAKVTAGRAGAFYLPRWESRRMALRPLGCARDAEGALRSPRLASGRAGLTRLRLAAHRDPSEEAFQAGAFEERGEEGFFALLRMTGEEVARRGILRVAQNDGRGRGRKWDSSRCSLLRRAGRMTGEEGAGSSRREAKRDSSLCSE
jgi:hypothetical protein